MDFSFSDEQQMLRDSLSRYLQNHYDFEARQKLVLSDKPFSNDVWKAFAEMGLLALPFGEEQGGLGGTITDIVAVSELLGEMLVIEPYNGLLLAGRALAASQSEMAENWLGRIMAGEAIATLAHEEGRGTAEPNNITFLAEQDGKSYSLSGEKRFVLNGAEADLLIVTAKIAEDAPVSFLRWNPMCRALLFPRSHQSTGGRQRIFDLIQSWCRHHSDCLRLMRKKRPAFLTMPSSRFVPRRSVRWAHCFA